MLSLQCPFSTTPHYLLFSPICRFTGCNLTEQSIETLSAALKTENSLLKELDLCNNNLQDSGVEKLSDGLKSSHCKVEKLRSVYTYIVHIPKCKNTKSVIRLCPAQSFNRNRPSTITSLTMTFLYSNII
uniref:SPRY-associated domain-containing protein n=1 Tax=Astyanax mexicanus TaxID=7994 RepID=A0A3B1KHQ6_ASTMX